MFSEDEELNEYEQAIEEMMARMDEKEFPDLTGDGKVTRADILKGRGVDLDEELEEELSDQIIHDSHSDYLEGAIEAYQHILGKLD